MGIGQAVAEGQFAQFTRVQESTADQIATKLLLATHQSPMGMYETFQRFAAEEAQGAYKVDKFAVDHPTGQDRVFDLNDVVEASPYREVQDSPRSLHTFQMVQAKLAGYVLPVKDALHPLSRKRHIRTGALCPCHDLSCASPISRRRWRVNGLIAEEPNNPYFYEVRGQIYLSMAKPDLAIPDYRSR